MHSATALSSTTVRRFRPFAEGGLLVILAFASYACDRAPMQTPVAPAHIAFGLWTFGARMADYKVSVTLEHLGATLASYERHDFSAFAERYTPTLSVPGYDTLHVLVMLRSSRDQLVARVPFSIPLQPSYQYGVGLTVGGSRPRGTCVGRLTATPIREAAADGDSLFVGYVGLPEGAVC